MLFKVTLYHEGKQFGYKICLNRFECARISPTGKIGTPSAAALGWGRRAGCGIGFQRA
jgi:hypothetical protein